MRSTTAISGPAIGLLGILLAACGFTSEAARGPELPDDHGLYALVGGEDEYQQLDGDGEWERETWLERSNLGPHVKFVIYHPALAADARPLSEKVRLQKVAWLRSEIDSTGAIRPVPGGKWTVPDVEQLFVPAELMPIQGRADAIYIVPVQPLEPGLYSLQLTSTATPVYSRLGVQWNAVDQTAYAAANCIDRYVGNRALYRPCAQQSQALGEIQAQELKIHLVDPENQNIDGEPTLVVKGVVINTAADPRIVPSLEASVQDRQGGTLHSWRFKPSLRELAPGQSVSFRTDLRNPPRGTAKVNVRFAPTVEAGIAQ